MKFTIWSASSSGSVDRLYADGNDNVYIIESNGLLVVANASYRRKAQIVAFLQSRGIVIDNISTLPTLIRELMGVGLIELSTDVINLHKDGMESDQFSLIGSSIKSDPSIDAPLFDCESESVFLNSRSINIQPETLRDIVVELDDLTSDAIFDSMSGCGFKVRLVSLPVFTCRVLNEANPGHELVFVRVDQDRLVEYFGSGGLAHQKLVSVNDYVSYRYSCGIKVKVVWVYEFDKRARGDLIAAIGGLSKYVSWFSYVTGISGHSIVEAYNVYHTRFWFTVYIRNFFEGKHCVERLYLDKLDGSKSDKNEDFDLQFLGSEVLSKQMVAVINLLNGLSVVSPKVSEQLARTGRSFQEIISMSEVDFLSVQSISPEMAKTLYQLFNLKS